MKRQEYNYHTHTWRCLHAEEGLSDRSMVEAHIREGFSAMAFTDHCPWKTVPFPEYRTHMYYGDKKEYLDSIKALSEEYRGVIDIRYGFEMEYMEMWMDEMREMRDESTIMILGNHIVTDRDGFHQIFDPRYHMSADHLRMYGDAVCSAMEKGLVDIVAHPDCFMANRKEFGSVEEEVSRTICHEAALLGIPLEINLNNIGKALRRGSSSFTGYPDRNFWSIAAAEGVSTLYGIDAHNIWQVELFDSSVDAAAATLGDETVSSLRFLTLKEISERCTKR